MGLVAVLPLLFQYECMFSSVCMHVYVFWLFLIIAKFQLQEASTDCITDTGLQVNKQTSAVVNPPVVLKSNLGHKSRYTDYSFFLVPLLLPGKF